LRKVVVLGRGGAGKSTLAVAPGAALGVSWVLDGDLGPLTRTPVALPKQAA
jgi:adenylate kinase family enzyme